MAKHDLSMLPFLFSVLYIGVTVKSNKIDLIETFRKKDVIVLVTRHGDLTVVCIISDLRELEVSLRSLKFRRYTQLKKPRQKA